MAPNRRGGPPSFAQPDGGAAGGAAAPDTGGSVITKAEVEARGSGTDEHGDSYDKTGWPANEIRVIFTGLMFLTRLPCPEWVDHHPAYLMRSMAYFPLFGALIGAWGATFFDASAVLWNPYVAAAVSTLSTVWLTGCFHEDGLSDCFDGFGGGWGRQQILRIMKDSRIGTYALVGMVLVLWQKLHVLAALPPADVSACLIAAHTASRWTSMALIYALPFVQDEEDAKRGIYNWFAQSRRLLTLPRLALGTLSAVLVPVALLGAQRAALMHAACVVVTVCAGLYGNAIIGGVIGDFLGATIQVAELACYMAVAADWSALTDWQAARPLAVALGVALLPVLYCRRIVDFGNRC